MSRRSKTVRNVLINRITEAQLHRAVAQYLRRVLTPPAFFSTFPAGGGGRVRGAQLKAMGLRAGMPDLLVFAPGKIVGLELKAKKGTVSVHQSLTAEAFRQCDMSYLICRSVADVSLALRAFNVPHLKEVIWKVAA